MRCAQGMGLAVEGRRWLGDGARVANGEGWGITSAETDAGFMYGRRSVLDRILGAGRQNASDQCGGLRFGGCNLFCFSERAAHCWGQSSGGQRCCVRRITVFWVCLVSVETCLDANARFFR
jgi:hypothetical protein